MAVDENLAQQVKAILLKRINDNALNLPPPTGAMMRCMALVRDPNASVRDVAAIVERDPVVAARVVRAANSAASATLDRVVSIPQCLSRVGLEKLKSILIELSASRLFESRDPRIGEACRGLWEHSVAVALLARDVAALCGAPDPEASYLAGLLHDVGKPVSAWLLLEAEKGVVGSRTNYWIEPTTWVQVVQRTHRPVGLALAQRWNLPEPVQRAIADCADYDSTDRLCAANCVRFANALVKREGLYVGEVDRPDVDALVMIGRSLLGLDDTVVQRLSTGLADRVRGHLT